MTTHWFWYEWLWRKFKVNELSKLNGLSNISWTFHGQKSKTDVQNFLAEVPFDLVINCSDTEDILPTKFGIDKRIFHYSALITSGQLSKKDALKLITSKEYFTSGQMKEDKEFIEKKLGFTTQEFDDLLLAKPKPYWL